MRGLKYLKPEALYRKQNVLGLRLNFGRLSPPLSVARLHLVDVVELGSLLYNPLEFNYR